MTRQPQLRAIAAEYHAATERLQRLAGQVPLERWLQRPQPDR